MSTGGDETPRTGCRGLEEGLVGLVGHWMLGEAGHGLHAQERSLQRKKLAFRRNVCRFKDVRLGAFSPAGFRGHVRQTSVWGDVGTAAGQ